MFVPRAFDAWWLLCCLPNPPPGREGRVSHPHQLVGSTLQHPVPEHQSFFCPTTDTGLQVLLGVLWHQTGEHLGNINVLKLRVNQLEALCSGHIQGAAAAFQSPGRGGIPAWLQEKLVPVCSQLPAPAPLILGLFLWEPAAKPRWEFYPGGNCCLPVLQSPAASDR